MDGSLPIVLKSHVARRVGERGVASVVIGRDLERYYLLLADARAGLRGRFTDGEINLICHVLEAGMLGRGLRLGPFADILVAALVAPVPARFADVDRAALTATLQTLSLVEVAALADALEQFWLAAWDGGGDWAPGAAIWDGAG